MRILLADDERAIAITLRDDLERAGHKVTVARDGTEARAAFTEQPFDVLITDIRMPGASGIELLGEVKKVRPDTEVVIITGYGTIESAVDATRKGAFEYILKPFDNDQILVTLRKIEEFHRLRRENAELRETLGRGHALEQIVGRSPSMQKALERVRAVAENDANVLVTGESGTGKERIARAIHDLSKRRAGPFVALACAAIPGPLLEDEIFGHERGAFTDAKERKAGRFERADGGTIFLDDIDDMPLETQVKLLRVLQERQFERLGGEKPIRVDVRVIAATKVDLGEAVEDGEFREDLYYRLNVVPLHLPSLREREGDVPLLIEFFLKRFAPGRNLAVPPEVVAELSAYRWPGNVRELENAVERAVALAPPSGVLSRDVLLESALRRRGKARGGDEATGAGDALVTLKEVVRECESAHIRRVLKSADGPPRPRRRDARHLPQEPVGEDERVRDRIGAGRGRRRLVPRRPRPPPGDPRAAGALRSMADARVPDGALRRPARRRDAAAVEDRDRVPAERVGLERPSEHGDRVHGFLGGTAPGRPRPRRGRGDALDRGASAVERPRASHRRRSGHRGGRAGLARRDDRRSVRGGCGRPRRGSLPAARRTRVRTLRRRARGHGVHMACHRHASGHLEGEGPNSGMRRGGPGDPARRVQVNARSGACGRRAPTTAITPIPCGSRSRRRS